MMSLFSWIRRAGHSPATETILQAEKEALGLRLVAVAAVAAGLYSHQQELAHAARPAAVLIVLYLVYVLSLKYIVPILRSKYVVYSMILIDSSVLILALHLVGGLESNLFVLFPVFVILYSLYLDYQSSFFAATVISGSLILYATATTNISSSTFTNLVYQIPLLFLLAYFSGFAARRASQAEKRATDLEGMVSALDDTRSPRKLVEDAVESGQPLYLPEIRHHAAPDGTVTILFTDIEGSSLITERLGDLKWMEVLGAHNTIIREQLSAYRGYEVKSQGDGFMLAFQSARRALFCAVQIQRSLAIYNEEHPDRQIHVRMGLHAGDALADSGDFYGRIVILAARISDQARGGEILASELIKDLTGSAGDINFQNARELELKGLSGKHRVFEVSWD